MDIFVDTHWKCLYVYLQHVTEIEKTYFEIYIYHESCPLALSL